MPKIPNFKILKTLGKGTFGVTYLVTNKKNQKFALKTIDIEESTKNGVNSNRIQLEIDTLINLSSYPHCYPYIACYYTSSKGTFEGKNVVFILSEYVKGPSFQQLIDERSKLDNYLLPNILWLYMYQLISGLNYIHKLNYAHRDIKPENIILNEVTNMPKIIDFGLSCMHDCKDRSGSLFWLPPEVFDTNYVPDLDLAKAHDVWSLGVVFYELANFALPFHISDFNDVDSVLKGILSPPIESDYNFPSSESPIIKYINYVIDSMLNPDPYQRPEVDTVINFMEDKMR